MDDTATVELGRNLLSLFTDHAGGTAVIGHHIIDNDYGSEDVFTLSFVGGDKQSVLMERETLPTLLAAAVKRTNRKTCKSCGLKLPKERFKPRCLICLRCHSTRVLAGRKS